MAMAKAAILAAVVAALAVTLAAAVDHPVGGDGSWDASGSGYDAWSATQTFKQDDTLSFKFSTSHDVTEVTKAGYDACSGANPIKSYSGSSTTVKLSSPGKRYFICSVPGHCASGMKLEVTVVAAATVTAPAPAAKTTTKPRHKRSVAPTPAPAPAAAPAPDAAATSTDELPNVSTPTSSPKSSDAATLRGKAVVGLVVAVAMAALAM